MAPDKLNEILVLYSCQNALSQHEMWYEMKSEFIWSTQFPVQITLISDEGKALTTFFNPGYMALCSWRGPYDVVDDGLG